MGVPYLFSLCIIAGLVSNICSNGAKNIVGLEIKVKAQPF